MLCVAASSLLGATPAHADPLHWTRCPAGSGLADTPRAECATLAVPLDYAQPGGARIDVMVSRIPAREPGRRVGALFGNPGGPGGEALDHWAARIRQLPGELLDRFDLLSVEPRGLRWSTPLDCRASDGKARHAPQGLPDLPDKLACEARQPGYIDAINTEATARDLESVRQALGERRIDFLGVSAGTNLGSVYATLYPEHVDKLVLDSGVGPNWVWNEQFAQETWAWQARIDDLFDWIAANDDHYGLGRTRAQVYAVWADQVSAQGGGFLASLGPQSSAPPVPGRESEQRWRARNLLRSLTHPGIVEGPTFTATFTALYHRQYWPYLAQGMRETRADRHRTRYLKYLAKKAPVDDIPTAWVFEAVTCNETRPADPAALAAGVEALATGGSSLDFVSDARRGGLSCLDWPSNTAAVYPDGARLATRPLLLQSYHDPATPARGAMELAAAMHAKVIRVTGGDHGQFGLGNAPVDDAVVRYLETGTVTATVVDEVPIRTPNPPTRVPTT